MAQPVDAIALQLPHGARVVIGPYRLRAVFFGHPGKIVGHLVERLAPVDGAKPSFALGPDPLHRLQQPLRMVNPLGVTRDLGTDDTLCIAVVLGSAHPADAVRVDALHLQRTGGRTVVRTNAGQEFRSHGWQPPQLREAVSRRPGVEHCMIPLSGEKSPQCARPLWVKIVGSASQSRGGALCAVATT